VQQVVVVQLADEGDPMHVAARHDAEDAEGRGHGAALPFERELQNVRRVEVEGVLGKARTGRVLDALVDREDREVPGAAEAAVAVEGAEVAQH